MCQSNTTNLYYVFILLGKHVSIPIESSSSPSKKIDPYQHNKGLLCLTDTSLYILYTC